MPALAGAGAAAGGLTGALIGMGMPEYEAKQYEEKMKGGNILISKHTEDGAERTRVKEIFKNAGAVTAAEDIVDRATASRLRPRGLLESCSSAGKGPDLPEPDPAV